MDKTTGLYCRCSTDQQTTESQEHDLQQRARQLGGRLVWYRDVVSGAATSMPALDKLTRDVANHKVGRVVVWALDRISRKGILDGLQRLRTWLDAGVEVVSVREGWVQATTDPAMRELLLSIAFWGASQERNRMRERTRAGLGAARARGVKLGRQPGDVGHKWSLAKRRIDPELARSLRQQGLSVSSIASRFGVTRPTVYAALRSVQENSPV